MLRVLLTLYVLFIIASNSFSQSTSNSNWDDRFSVPGLEGSFSDPVYAVATKDSMVFLAGRFSQIGGVSVNNMAMFNGRRWMPVKGLGVDTSFNPFSLPSVNAMLFKDNLLIVGGNFTYAGGVPAKNIAVFNTQTQQWFQLGSGVDHVVQCLFLDNDTLYIGFNDTYSDGIMKYSFSGNNYLPVGGRINGPVYAIEKYGNILYAGGVFDSAGTSKAKNIARFNGIQWSAMSWGFDVAPPYFGWAEIRAIKGTPDGIYAGGFFNVIERADTSFSVGVTANNIALFNLDSNKWYPVTNPDFSQGVDGYVYSLKMFNNELHIGGNFMKTGADSTMRFAKYNKAQGFRAVGGGLAYLFGFQDYYYGIKSMYIDDFNNLVIAGNFINVGSGPEKPQLLYVAKWNGTAFGGYGQGIQGYSVNGIGVSKETQPRIFITGENLPYAGDKFIGGFGYYDGEKWLPVKSGGITGLPGTGFNTNGIGNCMAVTDSFIYIGGRFNPFGPVTSTNVLRYNYRTNTFSGLGAGVTGVPYAVDAIAVTSNGHVFIAGDFTEVGGVPATYLAKWNGTTWSAIGTPNDRIYKLKANGNKVYAGGEFTTIGGVSYKYCAEYDALSNTWSALGTGATAGTDNTVYDFAFMNDDVYIGGGFSTAGGVNSPSLVKYNTTTKTFSQLGSGIKGMYSTVFSLTSMGNLLYVSGYIDSAGTVKARNIARWNGARWDSVGSGIHDASARVMANDGMGNVYLGGRFTFVGDSIPSSLFAVWHQYDYSSSAGSVTVTYPNGGETLVAGTNVNIAWSSSSVMNVKIELTTNNGLSWTTIIAATPSAAGTYSWTVTNTPSAQCKIRITDVSNSSVTDVSDNTFTISNQICKNISVSNGWNLVSVPVAATSMLVSGLFPTATSAAYGYSNGYSTFTTLENSKGYWLKFGSDQNVNICGNPIASSSVNINAGWNLIGVYNNDIAVSGLTTTPPGIITSAYYGYAGGYSIPVTLMPGKGYFVKASANGVINLPSGSMAKSSGETAFAGILKDAYEVSVTDNTGSRAILYFTGSGNDLSMFSMPPAPPQGIFDVRFAGDRMVTEKGKTEVLNISGAVYPVTVKFEKGAGFVKDIISGTFIDKNLQEGGSVVIADSRIEKLQITTKNIPDKFSLSQNYPNPFNPKTIINYELPITNYLTIKIYDVLGKEIETLVNREQEAGSYSVEWNASKYSSGIYYYELKTGSFREIKKMILMK